MQRLECYPGDDDALKEGDEYEVDNLRLAKKILARVKDLGVLTTGIERNLICCREFYYERATKNFWHEAGDGIWQAVTKDMAADLLVADGVSPLSAQGELSDTSRQLVNIVMDSPVDIVARLAGYRTGVHEILGSKVLVPATYDLIEPVEGDCGIILEILTGLLGEKQLKYFVSTLKIYYESLRDNRAQPGQMMILCGPADGCKSFVQHHIITPVYGGRSADAHRYLMGKTDFNADLFGAEHLFLDDAKPYGSWLSRHDFAENLKAFIVGKAVSYHAKGRTAVTLTPRWRVTMSLNDDDTAIRSLPDIAENFRDKLHLLHSEKFAIPLPNTAPAERAALEAKVKEALPGFVHYLLKYEIPKEAQGSRFGVTHYHHPDLLTKIDAMSDESQLEALIHMALVADENREWVGTADELRWALLQDRTYGRHAEKLLNWANAAGTLLGRLAARKPDKYEARQTRSRGRHWKIDLGLDAKRVGKD